jgi:hypothetical protein
MRKAALILLALLAIRLLPRTLRREARALQLVTALLQMTALAAANTSKAVSVENRTGNLETRVGNLEQGIFPNVSGGSTIILETQQGSVTLHCGALSNFASGPQTTFLSGLAKGQSPGGVNQDNNSGTTWAANERDQFINDLRTKWNSLLGTLISGNFINPA